MSTRLPFGFAAVSILLFAVAMGVAAWTWWPVYQVGHFVVLAVVTVGAGCLIALLGALFGWSAARLMLIAFGVYLLLGVPLAVPGQTFAGVLPKLDGIVQLVAGIALGWKQLLTIALPVGTYQALLVPVFALLLAASVAGLSIALRARHGELGVLAPVVVFVTGIVFGSAHEPAGPLPALALFVLALVWVAWRRWARRREALELLAGRPASGRARPNRLRVVVSASALLAVATAVSLGAAAALPPHGQRDVLRNAIEQPFDPRAEVSPLAGFRNYMRDGAEVQFRVTGLPAGARIRIATLDTYDGIVFAAGSAEIASASGTFTRLPYRIDRTGVDGDRVSLGFEIEAYSGIWLPTAGLLESVDFTGPRAAELADGFYYNDTTGAGAVVPGIESADAYRIESVLPAQPSRAEVAGLTPGSVTLPVAERVPEELTARLDEYVRGRNSAGERLLAMLDGLKRDGYVSHGLVGEPASRSGHSADRLAQLFSAPIMLGDAEQYAVAAALMARELGFPARVVFGFVPDAAGEATAVTGADASAWIEVHTSQHGWVQLDPNPAPREIPDEEPDDANDIARPQSVLPPPPEIDDDREDVVPPESTPEEPEDAGGLLEALLAVLRIAGWILVPVLVVLAPFLLVVAVKARRRALRRRSGDALQRIRGGWQEFEDAALDRGYRIQPAATRSEVAAVVGGRQTRALAAVADRATFSPDSPAHDDALRVWRAVDALTSAMNARLNRWQQFRAAVSLRSLRGYSFGRPVRG